MPIYYKKVNESESSHFLTDLASADDPGDVSHHDNTCGSGKLEPSTSRSCASNGDTIDWRDSALDLNSIELQTPLVDSQMMMMDCDHNAMQRLETKYGPIWLTEQSEPTLPDSAPTVITIHDIGFNHRTNFASYFAESEMRLLLRGFRVLHLTLPGQQDAANRLPVRYHFPTMQQLNEVIDFALTYCKIETFIGFGQGLGANLLLRFAIRRPSAVRGLILIHATADRASWSEWFYQRRNIRLLRDEQQAGLSPTVLQYLLWSQYGRMDEDRTAQLAAELRCRMRLNPPNPLNLAGLIEAWLARDPIPLQRSPSSSSTSTNRQLVQATAMTRTKLSGSNPYLSRSLSVSDPHSPPTSVTCDVLLITGMHSPHLNAVEQLFARLPPQTSSCIRFPDCGNPIDEQPAKLTQAIALFLQGLGHSLRAFQRRQSLRAGMSMPSLCLLPPE